MQSDLIFDIGCNNGDDTDFYLRKGFRVVAIDADEACCAAVTSRFAREIEAGRCEIVFGAVGLKTGETVRFYLCDEMPDWNTCDPYFVARNEKQGYEYRQVDVETINVADLMERWGTPYYMKIDVEGADTIPILCIEGRAEKPTYVSIEIAQHDLSEGMEQIHLLDRLGYKRFNFFNQGLRAQIKAPRPALEGRYAQFDGTAVVTGLFGKELGGRWLDLAAAERRFVGIHRRHVLYRDHKLFSKSGQFGGTLISKLHNRFRRHVLGDPVTWYELHASL